MMIQKCDGCLGVRWIDLQAHSAAERPLKPGHVEVGQKAFDPGGFKASFGQERFGYIPELANGDEFVGHFFMR